MHALAPALAFIAAIGTGGYLIMHDHATLGGWICILSLIATWGFETNERKP